MIMATAIAKLISFFFITASFKGVTYALKISTLGFALLLFHIANSALTVNNFR
jgi:hypothetical protein